MPLLPEHGPHVPGHHGVVAAAHCSRDLDRWDPGCEDSQGHAGPGGHEATTIRDIAAAAELSTGSVYRLVGSKDELLASIMRSFVSRVREVWGAALTPTATVTERLDALMWANINVVDRFSDEYNIQLAWLRESPPATTNLGWSFASRLREVSRVLAEGVRTGELDIDGSSAGERAWATFELLWMPEDIVASLGVRGALAHTRDTVLRGAVRRTEP